MRNPGGYAIIVTPEATQVNFDHLRCEEISAGTHEVDTIGCGHCGRVIHVKPRMDPADMGGLCKICMKFECPACVGGGCAPLEKRLEIAEKRDRARRSYGL